MKANIRKGSRSLMPMAALLGASMAAVAAMPAAADDAAPAPGIQMPDAVQGAAPTANDAAKATNPCAVKKKKKKKGPCAVGG